MVFALFLPCNSKIYRKTRSIHALALICGGLGLLSFEIFTDAHMLVWSMIGIGIARSSILAMPYAILAGAIPASKMGVYMGIFNFFITIPQIINGIFNGFIVEHIYNREAIYALSTAGIFLLIAALSAFYVKRQISKYLRIYLNFPIRKYCQIILRFCQKQFSLFLKRYIFITL